MLLQGAESLGGNIAIAGASVNITESSSINASTSGTQDGGNIIVEVREDGLFSLTNNSSITTSNSLLSSGNVGDINITAASVDITELSRVDASTLGAGDAGDIIVEVTENGMFHTEQQHHRTLVVLTGAMPVI